MRGLKHVSVKLVINQKTVAPYVGAWIETIRGYEKSINPYVAPYVGAWIETHYLRKHQNHHNVAPYVGAWIETQ